MTGFPPKSADETADAAHARRRLLAVAAMAPTPLTTVTTLVAMLGPHLEFSIAYAADRQLLTRAGFDAYAAALHDVLQSDIPLERLAAAIADDIANELVPRWLQIVLTDAAPGRARHRVAVEDRQPGWDHPALPPAISRGI